MKTSVTSYGHASRAYSFYKHDTPYLIIGMRNSWSHEPTPDDATIDSVITDIIGYKKIDSKLMVELDPSSGTITYKDQKWSVVDPEQAISKKCNHIYITATINYDEFSSVTSYRQIGIVTKLEPKPGKESSSLLMPTDVKNPGWLEILENRTPVYRSTDQMEKLAIILEF